MEKIEHLIRLTHTHPLELLAPDHTLSVPPQAATRYSVCTSSKNPFHKLRQQLLTPGLDLRARFPDLCFMVAISQIYKAELGNEKQYLKSRRGQQSEGTFILAY